MAGRWFSLGTLVSSTNKIDCHDITEILLKVALNTTTITLNILMLVFCIMYFVLFVLVLWFVPIVGCGSGLSILDYHLTFSNFIKRVLYFYQMLSAFSKLKIISEGYWFIFEKCHENTLHLINNIYTCTRRTFSPKYMLIRSRNIFFYKSRTKGRQLASIYILVINICAVKFRQIYVKLILNLDERTFMYISIMKRTCLNSMLWYILY